MTWNAEEFLPGCLRSVPAAVGGLSHEILVVDNASEDRGPEIVEREFPAVKLLRNPENLGLGRANDLGFAASKGRHVAFCNPDVVFEPGSLATLVGALRERPRAGMVGPQILGRDGEEHHRGPIRATGLRRVLGREGSTKRSPTAGREQAGGAGPVRCYTVHGCCMVLSREALAAIGGFPTDTFLYGEEELVGARLASRGFEVWHVPAARVQHFVGHSVNQRWSWFERNVIRRSAIIQATRVSRSRAYFVCWNLARAAQALVGWAGQRDGERRRLRGRLARLHLRALLPGSADPAGE